MTGVRARAKVNLRLRVLGREVSGYHALETIFLALDLADEIDIELASSDIHIEVSGDSAVPADRSNLCCRAVARFGEAIGRDPSVRIRLRKRIPSGAGLGGGSSDAAAVLVALNEAEGAPLDAAELAALGGTIGSDIPFFVSGAAMALGWERGRRMLPLPPPPRRPVLLVVPPFQIPTAEAYAWLSADRASAPAVEHGFALPAAERLARWSELERLAANDFESVVFPRWPALERARDALRTAGAGIALLCGSGSCVFGVFTDELARDAADGTIGGLPGLRTIRTATSG